MSEVQCEHGINPEWDECSDCKVAGEKWRREFTAEARAEGRAEGIAWAIEIVRNAWPKAHTYASENADIYHAQDDCAAAILAKLEAAAREDRTK